MSEQEMSVVDVVSEGRYQATFALRTLFQTERLEDLVDFVPLVNALQGLPQPLIEEVGIVIVKRFFEDENLDPSKDHDRAKAAPFVPALVASINTAAQAVFQNMQMQAQQQQRSRQKLLAPGGPSLM